MSAQVGTLQRTGLPRMIWPSLAIVIVLGAGIATVAVVTDDRVDSQTSAGSPALTAETDRLTALAETFEASTRSMTTEAARWTAIAESFGTSGVVLGVTTPTELRGILDGSTTGAPAPANGPIGPIGFHPLP